MERDARPAMARLVHALRHGSDVSAVMLRVLDDAEQAAARIDWSGGGDGKGPEESVGDLPPLFRGISLSGLPLDHLVAPGQMTVGTAGSVFRVQDDDTPLRPEDGDLLHGREPRRPEEPPPPVTTQPPSPEDALPSEQTENEAERQRLYEMTLALCELLYKASCGVTPDMSLEDLESQLNIHLEGFFSRVALWVFAHWRYQWHATDVTHDFWALTAEERFMYLILLAGLIHVPPDFEDYGYDPLWIDDPEDTLDEDAVPSAVYALLVETIARMRTVLQALVDDPGARGFIVSAWLASHVPDAAAPNPDGLAPVLAGVNLPAWRRVQRSIQLSRAGTKGWAHMLRRHYGPHAQSRYRFPESWSEDDIEYAIRAIYTDNVAQFRTHRFTRYGVDYEGETGLTTIVMRGTYRGVEMEIIIEKGTGRFLTAFPIIDGRRGGR